MEDVSSARRFQRPEIDGLRAIAIIPVVLFHTGLGCPGGFIGVDVFFVISGFLIGGIIFRELDAGTFSFAMFWERRVRRIVPVLLVFFAVTLLCGWKFLFPPDFVSLGAQMIASLAGLANFKMLAMTGGYWGTRADSLPLLHIWSLAVEEQFYLLMPILLVVSYRWFRRWTFLVMVALFALSLSLSFYWGENDYTGNFYLLPSRGWELLLGCLGAWSVHRRQILPKSLMEIAAGTGLLLILISVVTLHEDPKWPDSKTLLPTIGTLLILIAPRAEGRRSAPVWFLSLPPLRYIGLISYSLYLWHWPMIVFLRNHGSGNPDLSVRWAVVAASVALASISWFFVEQAFRNKLRVFRVSTRPLLIGAGGSWLCLMMLSQEVAHTVAPKIEDQAFMPTYFSGPGIEAVVQYDAIQRWNEGGIQINSAHHRPRCVVLGSSHGMMLVPAIQSLSDAYHIPCAILCEQGTSAFFVDADPNSHLPRKVREKREHDEVVKKYISQWKPDLVIIAGRWSFEMEHVMGNPKSYDAEFQETYLNTVAWLGQYVPKIVVLGEIPILPMPEKDNLGRVLWNEYRQNGHILPKLQEPPEITAARSKALTIFHKQSETNITIVDLAPFFQNADRSLRYYGNHGIFYIDNNHLNASGAMELKPVFEPFFKAMSQHTELGAAP